MELGGSLPHSQQSTTCPYPSGINPFLCPSHFCWAQLVSFLVGLRAYQHHGTVEIVNVAFSRGYKKKDVFYLVVKSQRAWICLNPSSSVCCVSCRSCMYWKRLSLTSLPSWELATGIVRHELRHRFTECQPIRHIHVKNSPKGQP